MAIAPRREKEVDVEMNDSRSNSIEAVRDSLVATLLAVPLIYLAGTVFFLLMPIPDQIAQRFRDIMPFLAIIILLVSLVRSLKNKELPSFALATKGVVLVITLNTLAIATWFLTQKDVFGDQYIPTADFSSKSSAEEWRAFADDVSSRSIATQPASPARDEYQRIMANWVASHAVSCIEKAIIEIGREDYQAAISLLLECSQDTTNLSRRDTALSYLGIAYYRDRSFLEADKYFILALESGQMPRSELLLNRALAMLAHGNEAQGIELWREAIRETGDRPCLPFLRGLWHFENESLQEAEAEFRETVAQCSEFREQAELYLSIIRSRRPGAPLSIGSP